MEIFEIKEDQDNLNKIKEIYYSSFPEIERVDFQNLVDKTFPNSKLLGIFNGNILIGFTFISEFGDFSYIIYFAIEEKLRNKNYGTTALKMICDLYHDKTKVLCVEKPTKESNIPARRISFYKRNGFMLTDFEFEWSGQVYYSMFNGNFDKQKFIDFLYICFPTCKDFKNI